MKKSTRPQDRYARILIVEDTEADADLAKRTIRKVLKDCEFQVVETRKDFLKTLEAFEPDLILSDYHLPNFDGMTALKLAIEHAPFTPLIIWTGSISEDVAVDCMKAGANNYVLKENIKRLGPAVIHALGERELLVARKQAEERIKERERQLTLLFSNLPGPVYRCRNDADYTMEFISDNITELSGYQAEDFRQHRQHFSRMIHPDDRERVWADIQTAVERGQPFVLTYRIQTAAGEKKWVWDKGQGIFDAQGQLEALEGFITDITERKQAEESLRHSEKRFRALIENGLDNISLLSADGTLIWESPATIRTLDYAPDEFVGRNMFELIHPDDLVWLRDMHTKLLEEPGGHQRGTFRLRHSDGTWRWVEAIVTNLLNEPGVNAMVVNYRDVTKRKQAEIELQQSNDDLALINALNEVVNRGEGLDAVVKLIAKEIKRIYSGEGTTIYLLNPDGQSLKMQQYFLSPEITGKIEKVIGRTIPTIEIPIQEGGYFQSVLRSGRGTITSDPQVIQKWMGEFVETNVLPPMTRRTIRKLIPQIYKLLNIKSTIIIPLISGGETIGLLDVSSPNLFKAEDLKRIENIGGQLTTALRRKQVEDVRKEERNLLRTLIDHLPDRIYVIDAQGRKTIANTADWKASGGTTMEDVIGKTVFDTYPHELAEQFWQLDKAVIDSGQPVINYEEPGLDSEGNQVSVLTTKVPLRDHDEKVIGLVGIGRDITERKQAEARINELFEFNKKILNHSPLGILTYKLTGECVFANENAASIVGTEVGQLMAQNFHTIQAWKRSGLYDLVEKAIATQAPVTDDVHHVSTFGKDIWMTVHCVTFKSKDEEHLLLAISDITERRQAEEALRESENRLVLALSGAQMSVWEWDLQTNHILWSPEFFEITGVKENDFGGTFESFTHLIHTEDTARVMASAEKAVADKTLFAEEFRIIRPDGEVRWLSNLGHAEYDSTRDHLRLIGTVQDITQRKQAEIERQALLEIMQGFANTKDLKELLKLVHQSIANVIPAENFFVVMYQPGSGLFEEIYSVDQYDPPAPPAKLEKSITSYVFRTGEPILLTQALFDELAAQGEVELVGTNSASWLGVPLKTSGRTIGVLAVQDYETANRYSARDRDFLTSIATQIALAIEHREAGIALRESEEHYRAIFEGVQDAMFVESIDGKILMVNKRACEMFGYSHAEFLTKTVADLVPKGHPILMVGEKDPSLSAEPRETVNRRANGETFPVEVSGRLQVINGETILLVVVRDITERKQVEAELQASEFRYRLATQATKDVIWEWNVEDNQLIWTENAQLVFGYSPAEAGPAADWWDEHIHPEDRERVTSKLNTLLTTVGGESVWSDEYRFLLKDGSYANIDDHAYIERDPSGRTIRMIGAMSNITKRKQAEEAEREQRVLAEALRDTAETLNSTLDYGEVLDRILAAAGRVVPHSAATIMLIDGETASVARSHGYDKPDFKTEIMGTKLPLAETTNLRQMLETGQPVVISDTHSYMGWKRLLATDWLRSNVGAPISIYGEVIGFILLDSETIGFFTPVHAERLEAFANQAAIAIHNARLLQQAQEEIAERKRAELALTESNTQFRTLFEASPDAIILIDQRGDWPILDCNTTACQMNGYTREELIGQPIDILNVEPSSPEGRAGYLEQVRRAGVFRQETIHRRKDGTIFPVDISTSLITLGGREVVLGIDRDITERKRAEQALMESITQFRTLFEASPEAIMLLDPSENWSILDCNTAACQMNGYTREELIGQSIDILNTTPGDPNERAEYMERVRQHGILRYETAHRRKNGSVITVEVSTSLIQYGKRDIVLGIDRDITERKRAEAELRASEERFRQLADNIQEVFWMTDAKSGRDIYISPAAEVIWGRSIEDMMQEPNGFINNVFPEDQPAVLRAIEREENGEKVEMEYRIVRPNGELRWVWDRAFPIFDDSGKVKRIAGISADITDRRASELALIKSQSRYRELFDSSPISIWEEDFSLVRQRINSLLESGVSDLSEYLSSHPQEVMELASLVKITDVNKASMELYGVEQKEQLLKNLTEALGRETIGHFQEEVLGLLSPVKRFTWEGTERTFDGRQMEVMVNGSVPHGYEEDWSKVIVSISDITERKQAEQALLRREQQLEEAQRLGHIGGWEWDFRLNVTTWSAEMYRLYDLDPQLPPFNFEEFIAYIHPDDRERVMQIIQQTIQTHLPCSFDYRITMTEGKIRWLHGRGEMLVDETGQAIRMQGIAQDVTQRKQSEMEINRHMAELEALYENGLAVGRLLKPREIGERIIETFARHLSWHHVAIRLKPTESDELELIAFNQPDLSDAEKTEIEQHFNAMVSSVGQGMSGWVVQTGEPLRVGDVHAHPQYIDTHAGIRSGLYMPLKIGERVSGVVSVESEESDAFTEQDERLLATLASQAAIALENARLYQSIEQELSERKRAEEALRASETHYRELADSITDILFELDHDLKYTHWNKTSEALTGVTVDEAIGRSMLEIFGETDEQARIGNIYEDVLKDRQPRTFETTIVLNEEKRSLEVNAYPSTRGVSVVAKDVTNRKSAESIMQKRFELIEYSAHHSLDELVQKTVDEVSELTGSTIGFFHFVEADQTTLGMQTWSTNALRLFNAPAGEGAHPPLDQSGVWAEAVRQRRPLIQNDYDALSEKKGLLHGHVSMVREIVIPILRNERIMAVMGIGNKPQNYTEYDLEIAARLADYAWDITERKLMEVALETERNQLAQRVEERTADLSRANSNLARALRVKDEFLANMSHELRTPLNAILGLSESLGEQIAGPLNEKQQKYITTISESGHHLLALINDILDLAKIEAGQITLDINKVDIHSVCQASLRMIKQLAQKKHQEVVLEIDKGLGLMWADERRLKQMIVNLLGNAVKFTPEHGKLGVQVHGDEDANKVTITVWDNGIGIKDNDLARLFQPFVQLDSGLARETTGTGLGLALVAQMARLHGGGVSALSEPGQGSRFSIVLPWEPALAMDAVTRMRTTGKFRAIKTDETNRPGILLVEDTKEVTMMIKDYLELAGYNVATAQDGVDAIVQAKLVRPDLILMDVQMPRMDGLEATRKLRSEPDFRYTPIIALTALAMPSDRENCLAAGMDEYISKPINLKALVKIIQSCLHNGEETKS